MVKDNLFRYCGFCLCRPASYSTNRFHQSRTATVVTITQVGFGQENSYNLEETLRLSELAFQVDDKAEYEVLRARVARKNQRNAVVQHGANSDLAFLALKQLFNLVIPTFYEILSQWRERMLHKFRGRTAPVRRLEPHFIDNGE